VSLTAVPAIIEGAPGNVITLPGTSLLAGAGASVVLQQQGMIMPEWASTTASGMTNLTSTFASSSVQFTVPDGAITGPLVITPDNGSGGAGTPIMRTMRVVSQYLAASDYLGEGVDLSALAPASTTSPLYSSGGELDIVLRTASAYIDTWLGSPARTMPRFETHSWRKTRRVYPYSHPIQSIDKFVVRISNNQIATIANGDIVINNGQRYIEILSYAVASYALLGAIQNLGLIANIIELNSTAGYSLQNTPQALAAATKMVATELLNYRQIIAYGLGGLSSSKQGNQSFDRRTEGFQIPLPALQLLRPFCTRRLG
jgi:hypothetical protein